MRFSGALFFVAAAALAAPASAVDWTDPRSVAAAALANNPTLLRLQSAAAAARERVLPSSVQPNPMLMAGVQNKPIDLSTDEMMTMYMVGGKQTFTRKSKLRARRSAAELEVRAAEAEVEAARAEIEREALLAWYDVASVDSQTTAAEQVRHLMDAIVDAARVRYEVGNAIQAEIIRAQLEKSTLDHLILTLRGSRNASLARLLPLVGLSPSTSVPRLQLPHATAGAEIEHSLTPPANHPALAAVEAEIERQDQLRELARLDLRPDISLEASYGHRPTQTDMISVVASAELPLRRSRTIDPRVREAVALRESAERRADEIRRDLSRALGVAAAVHDQANQQIRFHDEVLVPQARLAFESTLAAYQTGRTTFDSMLAAEAAYLRLQLDYYDYLAQHIKAIVDFEAIRKGATSSAFGSAPSTSVRLTGGSPAPASTMGGM